MLTDFAPKLSLVRHQNFLAIWTFTMLDWESRCQASFRFALTGDLQGTTSICEVWS
jgi:hypothetical protein